MAAKNPRKIEEPAPEGTVALTLHLPPHVYAALQNVAHDEGHSPEDQAQRAIVEMLRERQRRPLFD